MFVEIKNEQKFTVMTASGHIWNAAGRPSHPYKEESGLQACCATCGERMDTGVPLKEVETPTMSNHGDFFRFGTHVCAACAWLFAIGKGRPGNFLACGDNIEYLVISQESVVADKRPWLAALREAARRPPSTVVTGILTTDVKPRLWPRARLATVGSFGLYVHAPDYDISEWRTFDITACLRAIDAMLPPLKAGFAKASIYYGLYRDYARAAGNLKQTNEWERPLAVHRRFPHFLPALMVAGITREEKRDVRPKGTARNPEPAPKGGDRPAEAQLRLF